MAWRRFTGSRRNSAEQRGLPASQASARLEVFLPRATKVQAVIASAERAPTDTATGTGLVLVVDDDTDARQIAATFLREAGYVVEEAGSGPEARDKLAVVPVCLALVDYAMPMMSGSEFVHLARQIQPNLAVIYVTGAADTPALREQARDPIVMKPYSSATLLKAVRAVMLGAAASV